MTPLFDTFLFGGDWNPEQWPEETWEHDIEMLEDAHINEATINVFSWTLLQPGEDTYDFTMLDKIVALLVKHRFNIVLATGTAALPAWMVREHPEIIRTTFEGKRHVFGGRHNFCPNSAYFRGVSGKLAGALAERYAGTPGLTAWHIGNEYGGGGGLCYCENCAAAFRGWLKAKYGSVEALNKAWCANFWSHTIVDWADVVPPVGYGDGIGSDWDPRKCVVSGLLIDYRRFQNESQLACFTNERDAVRAHDAVTPITTNLMGTFKDLDYFTWGREMDVVSWDNYPGMGMPASRVAMNHDLMRAVGGGKPFMLMEQTPNQQNWFPYCKVKRPGEVAALSWQAVAHGADTVQFFQMRQSIGGCERFHGAVIAHDGTEDSRVFRETAALGEALGKVAPRIMGSKVRARVAVMFDWESYWSLEGCVGPTAGFAYPEEVHRFYRAFNRRNLAVDIIPSTTPAAELERYAVVAAPALIMVKPGVAEAVETYVRGGGRFITGYMSGIHDEHDLVIPGGYPGPFRALAGVWAEEIDAIAPGETIPVRFGGPQAGKEPAVGDSGAATGASGQCCGNCAAGNADAAGAGNARDDASGEIVASIMHLEGARVLATYGGDEFYAGTPAVTANVCGNGETYYVGTPLDESGMDALIQPIVDAAGLTSTLTPDGVEVAERYADDGRTFTFVINLTDREQQVSLPALAGAADLLSDGRPLAADVTLAPYQVIVAES
ncbi:beta-galactosidase [Bifidobacterium miconisargentati]|uniref:beta-galactosidase n=1 Tax=Bifidobacterium miconisargentati TaxID=2834437 RepID=UPI001BDDB16C|nr:beta-galactosidase [Bifidobacterium miconisargentati]MBW3089718.1 beta-galactosidase [Bifidobacterium miconisargentati]